VDVGQLASIQADPQQMVQLFQNLIGNALKFRRRNAPPEVMISVSSTEQEEDCGRLMRDDEKTIRIHVEDNGIGFDERHLERIFSPFGRLHGRHEYEGAGIGLAQSVRKSQSATGETSRPGARLAWGPGLSLPCR
jgi:two-component system sensor kinase FixL